MTWWRILLAALLGAGLTWLAMTTDRVPSPELQALRDSLAVQAEVLAERGAEVARWDSVAEDRSRELDRVRAALDVQAARAREIRAEADVQAREAGEDLSATLDSLRVAVPAPLAPLVDSARVQAERRDLARREAVAALETEVEVLSMRLRLTEGVLEVRGRQIEARDSVIAVHEDRDRLREREVAALEGQARQAESRALRWKLAAGAVVLAALVWR